MDWTLIQDSDEEVTSNAIASNVFTGGCSVEPRLRILRKSLADAIPLILLHRRLARCGGERAIMQLFEAVLASDSTDEGLYEGCFVLVSLLMD